jgi:hypothetical protein
MVVVTFHDCPDIGVLISWSFLSAASTTSMTQQQSQLVVAPSDLTKDPLVRFIHQMLIKQGYSDAETRKGVNDSR